MGHFNRFFISLIFVLLYSCTMVNAQILNQLETLVMPGPLAADHAEYEDNCASCHSPLDQTRQDTLCLECHKNIGSDMSAKSGFHGRNPLVSASECSSCHTDHEGREFDIVGMNRETFDHSFTDFALTGGHQTAQCVECHTADKKYYEATSTCISCHKEDDSHQGEMGENCSDCHTTNNWQEVKFNHNQTNFPLRGGHMDVTCNSCHPDVRYNQTPTPCISCHINNDDHEGRFGTDCATCHTEERWKPITFDHGQHSKFTLKGKHETIDCEACHTSTSPEQVVPTACVDCHLSIDIHRGQNGTDCAACHSESSWQKTDFNHDTDTKFVLAGAHQQASCFSCHRGNQPADDIIGTQCVDCHITDDVHNGKLGQNCNDCHTEKAWNSEISFDHDFTRFPLVGLHSITACDDCHISQEFAGVSINCSSCHIEEDVHKNTFGETCETCHNPNGWDFWQFDHNVQTKFPLDGSHTDLVCAACHTASTSTVGYSSLSTDCVSCHNDDDIHRGRFGSECEQCHITDNFKTVRMRR